MKLSIIIPVFNEENTIREVLHKIIKLQLPKISKEIIVVNDGSTDKTTIYLNNFLKSRNDFILINNKRNVGKGASINKAIKAATGEYILIQDADLEYDPIYIKYLVKPILDKKAQVVYGTRLKRWPHLFKEEHTFRFFLHFIGNRALSFLTSIFYNQWITDMETGYKIFPKTIVKGKTLKSKGFDFEPEITSYILKEKIKIYEIPITTTPRGYSQGKKLQTFTDGWKALKTLVRYRFLQ